MPDIGGVSGGGSGSGVPVGGTTSQVLKKASNADGDAIWVSPATVDHSAVPLASSGNGTPGAAVTAAAVDHVHPSSGGGSGGFDANMAIIPATTSSGAVFAVSGGINTQAMYQRGAGFPCRVSTSGIFLMGLEVTAAVAASFIRIAVFADSATGVPGALVFDSGQLDASVIGVKYSVASATLQAGVRYWFVATQEGGASGLTVRAGTRSPIPVSITSNQSYPGNCYRLGSGPFASNPVIVAVDADANCFAFLLKVP